METGDRSQKACKSTESEFFLQWGNRKRIRCVRVKDQRISARLSGEIRRKLPSLVDRSLFTTSGKESSLLQTNCLSRNSDGSPHRFAAGENRKSASPEKDDRYYTTRGSMGVDEICKVSGDDGADGEEKSLVWPKLCITLSSKEKEEDFMAMKGCRLPQRPKKRAKLIQRSLLFVSPGAWLTDMCQERYEVREKKSTKKRPRGLKAMGSVESDSD